MQVGCCWRSRCSCGRVTVPLTDCPSVGTLADDSPRSCSGSGKACAEPAVGGGGHVSGEAEGQGGPAPLAFLSQVNGVLFSFRER